MLTGSRRITPQLLHVLDALLKAPDHELHGWPLIQTLGVSGSSVYRILDRCEEEKLVTSRWDETGPGKQSRRMFKLTPDGAMRARALLAARRK